MAKTSKTKTQKASPSRRPRVAAPQNQPLIDPRRFALLAVIMVLGFVAITLLNHSGALSSLRMTLISGSIRQQMTEARQARQPQFDKEQRRRVEALKQAGVTSSGTALSTKTDSCSLGSRQEQKWTTVEWGQSCSLNYSDIIETSLTREQILEKLASANNAAQAIGTPSNLPPETHGRCDAIYHDTSHVPVLYFIDWSRGNNLKCDLQTPAKDRAGLHVINAYDTSLVTKDKSYLKIIKSNPYFTVSLGCGKQKLLFGCEQPSEHPITDFDKS